MSLIARTSYRLAVKDIVLDLMRSMRYSQNVNREDAGSSESPALATQC